MVHWCEEKFCVINRYVFSLVDSDRREKIIVFFVLVYWLTALSSMASMWEVFCCIFFLFFLLFGEQSRNKHFYRTSISTTDLQTNCVHGYVLLSDLWYFEMSVFSSWYFIYQYTISHSFIILQCIILFFALFFSLTEHLCWMFFVLDMKLCCSSFLIGLMGIKLRMNYM